MKCNVKRFFSALLILILMICALWITGVGNFLPPQPVGQWGEFYLCCDDCSDSRNTYLFYISIRII